VLAVAAAVAIALDAAIAALAIAGGAPADYGPLTFPAYALFTVVGLLLGWAGWSLVLRRAGRPRRVLMVLVPVVALLSIVPDILLLVFGFVPGTTAGAVVALVAMHVVVLVIGVSAFILATPRGRLDPASG
jgi:hypothetical protein